MKTSRLAAAGLLAAALGVCPAAAGADTVTFLTPSAGTTFGGVTPSDKFTAGLSLTSFGRKAGFEFAFGYTPDFFNQQSDFAIISGSNVTSLMGNVLVGPAIGHDGWIRPYVTVGAGLLRSHVGSSNFFSNVSTNDWALGAGGGVIAWLRHDVGIRGELHYFRSLRKRGSGNSFEVSLGTFDFWTAMAGVTLRL